jgi:predicted P-loop ATPase
MRDTVDLEEYKAQRFKRLRADWIDGCQKSDNGNPIPNLANAYHGMHEDERLKDALTYDEMSRVIILKRPIFGQEYDKYPRQICDNDTNIIQKYLQLCGLTRISKDTTYQAVELCADESRFHPLRTYLTSLKWDGEPRLKGWLNSYLGTENSPYCSQIGTMFMVAMVARILKPGCKADYMLILEGPQGTLKSTACATLAGEWFSDNLPDLSKSDPVRLSMHLRGKWLIEIAEMSSFNAAESHTLKEFLTQTEERYTPKFARNEVHEPRQCLFIGTTNQSVYLKDETGGRRFWPVVTGKIDISALKRDRDQLFAEAVSLFKSGTSWWPERSFEAEHIKPEQDKRYETDIWEKAIRDALSYTYETTSLEIATNFLNIPLSLVQNNTNKRIANILKNLGWFAKHTKKGTVWLRGDR